MANDLRLQVLLQALDKASGPLRNIDNASKNTSRAIRSTRENLRELELEQVQLKRALDTGKISTLEYGRANTLLQGRVERTTNALDIQTRAARNLGIQQQRLAQIERQRAQLGGKLMAAAGTAAVFGYGLSRIVGPGNEFDYQLQLIGNTADMTGAQVEDLRQKVMAASKATGQSAPTVEKALGFLVAAGLDADTAARSIQAIGRTSTAAGADIEDVSRAAFTLTDALDIKPEGLQKALDILSQAGKEGNVELRDMARQLPVLGAGFRSLKMGGNEAAASLGAALEIARKGAGDADEAANNMKNYLQKILSPTTLKKAQDEFGLDLYKVIQDAQSSGGNPFEASIEAVLKATGGDQKKLGELFQDMQAQNFLKPIMQNWGEYQRIKAKALAATGVTDRDFDKVSATAKQQLTNAANAAGRLGIAFSHTLAPGLGQAAAAIAPVLDRMTKFVDAHPKLVSGIAKVVAGLVGMRIALLGIRFGWTFIGGGLAQRSITKLRGALAKQAAARLAGGEAPAAGGVMRKAAQGAGRVFKMAGSGALTLARVLGRGLVNALQMAGRVFSMAGRGALTLARVLGGGLVKGVRLVGQALMFMGRALLANPILAVIGLVALGAYLIYKNWDKIKPYWDALWSGMKQVASAVWDAIVTAVGVVVEFYRNAWSGILGFMVGVGEGIKAPFVAAFGWIEKKIGWLIEKWQALKGALSFDGDQPQPAGMPRGWAFNDGRTPPPRFGAPPLRAGGGTSVTNNHYPIQVTAAPGREVDAAKAVSAELDRRDRAKAAATRSRLRDTE